MGWKLELALAGAIAGSLVGSAVGAGCSPSMREPTYLEHYDRERALCVGVPPRASPLDRLGVAAARRIASFEGRPRMRRTRGARLFVRSRPGWTRHRVEQWSLCHIERMALLTVAERTSDDPLAVEGIRAQVRQASAGFEIQLTTRDPRKGPELYRRVQALMAERLD